MNVYIGTSGELENAYIGEYIPMSGLLGYRPLQSDLKDTSGNGNDGTWQGGTGGFSTVGGYTGARITESSYLRQQYISTPISTIPGVKTFIAWAYFDYFKTDTYNWELIMGGNTSGGDVILAVREGVVVGSTTSMSNVRFNPGLSTSQRYLFAYTQSLTEGKIYLNGNLLNTVSGSYTNNNIQGQLLLGAAIADGQGMSGYIRHCAVYNRALTDAEVLEFYNNTN